MIENIISCVSITKKHNCLSYIFLCMLKHKKYSAKSESIRRCRSMFNQRAYIFLNKKYFPTLPASLNGPQLARVYGNNDND